MKISEIMSVNSVMLSLKAGSKRQLLQELARKASELTGINERTVLILFWNAKIWGQPVLAAERLSRTDACLN